MTVPVSRGPHGVSLAVPGLMGGWLGGEGRRASNLLTAL